MPADLIRSDQAQWDALKSLVLDSVTSLHTKIAYGAALDEFLAWYRTEARPGFTKATVQAYRSHLEGKRLAPSSINVRMSALRKLATEAADNGLLVPEVAAAITRVKGAKRKGVRLGNWLTLKQAQKLLQAPDIDKPKGLRDRAILAVLLGCGLRRSELAALTLGHIQQRDCRWVIVDLVGKHGRIRTVTMPAWVKLAIDEWTEAADISSGRVFRSVNKGGRVWGDGMTEKAVWHVVLEYSGGLGFENVAPHDLRRTCAKLCRAGGELEQIQLLLGHASVQTTERYLGTVQNLTDAPNDHIKLRLAQGQ